MGVGLLSIRSGDGTNIGLDFCTVADKGRWLAEDLILPEW